jgi:hypothetical protein
MTLSEELTKAYRVLAGKPKVNRPLVDLEIDAWIMLKLRNVVGGVEWVHLAQDRDN